MRHRKQSAKLGRTSSHRNALMVQQLKSLIDKGSIQTTVAKAKELRRHADRIITLSKKNTLASIRDVKARLRLHYNKITSKEKKAVKGGDVSSYNVDRRIFAKLEELTSRFANRDGGYTRIMRTRSRIGDDAPVCIIEYVEAMEKKPESKKAPEKASEPAQAKPKETKSSSKEESGQDGQAIKPEEKS